MILVNNIVWTALGLALSLAVVSPGAEFFLKLFAGIGIGSVCVWAGSLVEKALLP